MEYFRSWIFILEGLLTVILAIASFFILSDYPETANFLSDAEREFVIGRLQDEARTLNIDESLRWRIVGKGFKEWKTWMNCITLMGQCEVERCMTGY
jgi:DNA-directed RNA polymerase subunit E'/Rpb7